MQQGDLETGIWSRPNRDSVRLLRTLKASLPGAALTVAGAAVRVPSQP